MTRIIVVGPGRAGLALGLASKVAGHDVVAVTGRRGDAVSAGAAMLDCPAVPWGEPLPGADLLLLAVRDDAIAEVAAHLAVLEPEVSVAAHVSGLTSLRAMDPLAEVGCGVGSLHPLQTLPTPEAGAAQLSGAHAAVTGDPDVAAHLERFAKSLGMRPFLLDDDRKPLYHAAAAAAANFPLAALVMAEDLFAAAGVPFQAAEPLVRAIIDNAFELGPRAALTGPVARGDSGTVAAQLAAVRDHAAGWEGAFTDFVRHLAEVAGRTVEMRDVIS